MPNLTDNQAAWLQGIAAVASYDQFHTPIGFEEVIRSTSIDGASDNGYYGILYRHVESGALIWAHRGTDGFSDIDDDAALARLISKVPNQRSSGDKNVIEIGG